MDVICMQNFRTLLDGTLVTGYSKKFLDETEGTSTYFNIPQLAL